MPEPLKAPAWFLNEFCLIDGFFNEDRTAVVGRWSAHMSLPLLASGVIDKPFPQATVEIEKVGDAIRKRLADEGFLTTERSTVEPKLRLVLEPAPGETIKNPDFQSELADFYKSLNTFGIKSSSRHFTQDALGAQGLSLGEFGLLVSTLGPVAIVQLRKLIETFLKVRAGRKLKLKIGPLTLEGNADDVEKLISPEQIAKLLKAPKKADKKANHE
jgi:hypothetical protein